MKEKKQTPAGGVRNEAGPKQQKQQPGGGSFFERNRVYFGWFGKRAAMVVCDVVAAYLAYLLALVARFFSDGGFLGNANIYLSAFYRFNPWYALLTVAVFIAFGLYTSRWKFAGLHDMIRIILAHATLFVLQIAGTCLFLIRMPRSYYALGIFFQFCATCLIRFSLKIFQLVSLRYRREANAKVNVMLVGAGDTSNYVRSRIESFADNDIRIACILAPDSSFPGGRSNGVPVVKGFERIGNYVRKYRINAVYFTDPDIPAEDRRVIREFCSANNIVYQNYSDALQIDTYNLNLGSLLKVIRCPVRIRIGDESREFTSGDEARNALPLQYNVTSVTAEGELVAVAASERQSVRNDTSADWAKQTEAETGAPVSFF